MTEVSLKEENALLRAQLQTAQEMLEAEVRLRQSLEVQIKAFNSQGEGRGQDHPWISAWIS